MLGTIVHNVDVQLGNGRRGKRKQCFPERWKKKEEKMKKTMREIREREEKRGEEIFFKK